ncbi:hypothetical protein ANN_13851 [Periplaneta americana]|uniref:Reverse transcriptase domain-containing protein n=1 Tax=Periplaneta americana TaxID=6978 RepID=A0ABQ8SW65_PERAM|nr:hypothetical protein ANN_13851 [Periplaneta americana]
MGMNINNPLMHNLLFADNQVIIGREKDDVEYMLRKLIYTFEVDGSEVNSTKTEYMVVGKNGDDMRKDFFYLRRDENIEIATYKKTYVREGMDAEETVIDRVETKLLQLYGHGQRMWEERWPKRINSWYASSRTKRGGARKTWCEGISTAMVKGTFGTVVVNDMDRVMPRVQLSTLTSETSDDVNGLWNAECFLQQQQSCDFAVYRHCSSQV